MNGTLISEIVDPNCWASLVVAVRVDTQIMRFVAATTKRGVITKTKVKNLGLSR